jgi:hypothetical protein
LTRRDNITRRRAKGLWIGTHRRLAPRPDSVREHEVRRAPALQTAYKPAEPVKVAADGSGLKPYWGKPAVRNFREGGRNVVHGLMPICHEAPKGGHKRKALAYTAARFFSTQRKIISRAR